MRTLLLAATMLAVSAPVMAQDITSASGSGAEANSGSVSGASSNGNQQSQANIGGNNAGIGSSRSNSESGSVAVSGSESTSGSVSDQGQAQYQGQSASNQQGVSVSNTFNSTNHKRSYVGTNAAVPLTAAVSFSSDYCLGVASGGASIAPIGVSIGGSGPVADDTCRYLRLAQTGGMMAANWHNMGEYDMRNRMMAFATWSTCMAGPQADRRRKGNHDNAVFDACIRLGLLGADGSPTSPPSKPVATETPVAPEQVEKYKTPRGDNTEYTNNPVVQPIAMATATPVHSGN